MKALDIRDITSIKSLGASELAGVRGGYCGMPQLPQLPSCCGVPAYTPAPSTYTSVVDIAQANNQFQSNATGNGSAVFGGSISACNNQQGYNAIG